MTLTTDRSTLQDLAAPRVDQRIEDRSEVRIFEPFDGRFVAGLACNVSANGLCLLMPADANLRAGRFVTLHGSPTAGPSLGDDRMRAKPARVVWVALDPQDPSTVRVGLQVYAAASSAAA